MQQPDGRPKLKDDDDAAAWRREICLYVAVVVATVAIGGLMPAA